MTISLQFYLSFKLKHGNDFDKCHKSMLSFQTNSRFSIKFVKLWFVLENSKTVLKGATFLKDFRQLMDCSSECDNFQMLRYQLDDGNLEVRKSSLKKIYDLRETNSTLQTCWDESLPKNANIENLHEMPENFEKIKSSLKKAQAERVDKLYNMQTALSILIIAHQFKVLHDFYQELKICDNVIKNKDLFDLIDKQITEIKKDFEKIDENIKNSQFGVVNSKLDLVVIKFEELNIDLSNIEINLNGKKSSLENIRVQSRNSMISNGLQAASSWFKFYQYFKYSGESKVNLALGSLEAMGYSAIAFCGYKINRMTIERIAEVNTKIEENFCIILNDALIEKIKKVKLFDLLLVIESFFKILYLKNHNYKTVIIVNLTSLTTSKFKIYVMKPDPANFKKKFSTWTLKKNKNHLDFFFELINNSEFKIKWKKKINNKNIQKQDQILHLENAVFCYLIFGFRDFFSRFLLDEIMSISLIFVQILFISGSTLLL
ncbi:hypothetical protein BpHYR1_004032 [Brachionus plicatilis]|uniref:Uncharacterized protein n=1 Tax=Brachionus plicatilis TaxID=10195 RepID=A0A3M7T2Z5_BRAPC|nr:hypothetical protein BpHYR1_004032 [Brachionus plicatilis]